MMTRSAVLICPGRGAYNRKELGYLRRHHAGRTNLLEQFDRFRESRGQESVTGLDGAARFSVAKHTRGDNASPLIFASSCLDALQACKAYGVAGVTGNSMGWYTALTVAGATPPMAGFTIVNMMGALMQERLIGGQTIYPFVDENWRAIPGLKPRLLDLVSEIDARAGQSLAVSIHLGGMLVLAGDEAGLTAFEAAVEPVQGRYPMRLPNHAAFHTALQWPVAEEARARLGQSLFQDPALPLVDGRGAVWYPRACSIDALWRYTFDTQVVQTYDFTLAVQVAARTFAPDLFIVTGPGTALGGAVAQSLIGINWQGLDSKAAFQVRQIGDPILISMGRDDQRRLIAAE